MTNFFPLVFDGQFWVLWFSIVCGVVFVEVLLWQIHKELQRPLVPDWPDYLQEVTEGTEATAWRQ